MYMAMLRPSFVYRYDLWNLLCAVYFLSGGHRQFVDCLEFGSGIASCVKTIHILDPSPSLWSY